MMPGMAGDARPEKLQFDDAVAKRALAAMSRSPFALLFLPPDSRGISCKAACGVLRARSRDVF